MMRISSVEELIEIYYNPVPLICRWLGSYVMFRHLKKLLDKTVQ
jgi:hypothetical protein